MTSKACSPTMSEEARHELLRELYRAEYERLVRFAFLLGNGASAEDVVQEAFCRVYRRLPVLHQPDLALFYVRTTILNLTRSRARRARLAQRKVLFSGVPEFGTNTNSDISIDLLSMLKVLPRRQREAIVLRHYVDLSEAETAKVMRVRTGSVKGYAGRGIATLRRLMEDRQL